jgi:DNA-binding protein H-NS
VAAKALARKAIPPARTAPAAMPAAPAAQAAPDADDLAAMIRQRQDLDRAIQDRQKAMRSSVVMEVRRLVSEHSLTQDDVFPSGGKRRGPASGGTIAPKYRDAQGNQWTGRGMTPKWVKAALAGGAKLEDFLIKI